MSRLTLWGDTTSTDLKLNKIEMYQGRMVVGRAEFSDKEACSRRCKVRNDAILELETNLRVYKSGQ